MQEHNLMLWQVLMLAAGLHPLLVTSPVQHACNCTQAVSDIQLACFLALWTSPRQPEKEPQLLFTCVLIRKKAVVLLH